jgi:hypothetical protein
MQVETGTLVAILAVAAAAAVAVAIFSLRRPEKISVGSGMQLAPSEPFRALARVAAGSGAAATLAQRLRAGELAPDQWTPATALAALTKGDRRLLLAALAGEDCPGISRIQPSPGAPFDEASMRADAATPPGDRWVVAAPVQESGYVVDGKLALPALVQVCTVDWWLLTLSSCPVGRVIGERADVFLPGGAEAARSWQAPAGLMHPEDLRDLFAEDMLATWRDRLVAEINPHYPEDTQRRLLRTGAPGTAYEMATMEAATGAPSGEAVVVAVLERQGHPQYGLACPGGLPLLLANVTTQAAKRIQL